MAYESCTTWVGGTRVALQIWDTAGSERYARMAPLYYHNADAAIVVYDVSCSQSFRRAQDVVEELRRVATPSIVIALAGNKLDAIHDPNSSRVRTVQTDEARTYATENNLLFFETSAKLNTQVTELFHSVAEGIVSVSAEAAGPPPILLCEGREHAARRKRCC